MCQDVCCGGSERESVCVCLKKNTTLSTTTNKRPGNKNITHTHPTPLLLNNQTCGREEAVASGGCPLASVNSSPSRSVGSDDTSTCFTFVVVQTKTSSFSASHSCSLTQSNNLSQKSRSYHKCDYYSLVYITQSHSISCDPSRPAASCRA